MKVFSMLSVDFNMGYSEVEEVSVLLPQQDRMAAAQYPTDYPLRSQSVTDFSPQNQQAAFM